MNRYLFLILACFVGVLFSSGFAESKTCKCDQHKAEATGTTTCSLSESTDYCVITFEFPDPMSQPDAALKAQDLFQEKVRTLNPSKDIMFENFMFATGNINDYPLKPVSAGILTSLALSAIPLDQITKVAADFDALFATKKGTLTDVVSDFNEDGCLDVKHGDLRVLIIAAKSGKNGRCGEQ